MTFAMIALLKQAPFELFIARLIDASPEDQLTLEATSALYVDQNLYMDWDEMALAARDGAPDLCVFGANVPDVLKDCLTPLYTVEADGPFLGAFVRTGAANISDAEAAILSVTAEKETQNLLEAVGYLPDTQLGQTDFSQEVQALFQRYIQYLTNEGLFFYEF